MKKNKIVARGRHSPGQSCFAKVKLKNRTPDPYPYGAQRHAVREQAMKRRLLLFALAYAVLPVLSVLWWGSFGGPLMLILGFIIDLGFCDLLWDGEAPQGDDTTGTRRLFVAVTLAGGSFFLALCGLLYFLRLLDGAAVLPVVLVAGCSVVAGLVAQLLWARSKEEPGS